MTNPATPKYLIVTITMRAPRPDEHLSQNNYALIVGWYIVLQWIAGASEIGCCSSVLRTFAASP